MSEESAEVRVDVPSSVDWRAIIAGAVIAVGISTTLIAFGSGIGLSTASAAPTWRDASPILWMVSGLYMMLVALCSFGCGGYVAGRIRASGDRQVDENAFRDGMHGILAWGAAVLAAAVLAFGSGAAAVNHMAAQSSSTSPIGERTIASELDELFRGVRLSADAAYTERRAEAARILLKSSSHDGVPDGDRSYLARAVGSEAGLSAADALARVNDVIGKSADALHRARQALVMQTFLIAAALVLGAAVAWFAATEGGTERRQGIVPRWSLPARAVRR